MNKRIKKLKKSSIMDFLCKFLEQSRINHCINVASIAKELAIIYNVSEGKAELAGLLHDIAKDIPVAKYVEHGIDISKINNFDVYKKKAPQILHSFASAQLAKKEVGIKDPQILRAISSHTMGNKNMSTLDKIIFVADLIEPGRNFEGLDDVRDMAYKDLDAAVNMAFEITLKFLKDKNKFICT